MDQSHKPKRGGGGKRRDKKPNNSALDGDREATAQETSDLFSQFRHQIVLGTLSQQQPSLPSILQAPQQQQQQARPSNNNNTAEANLPRGPSDTGKGFANYRTSQQQQDNPSTPQKRTKKKKGDREAQHETPTRQQQRGALLATPTQPQQNKPPRPQSNTPSKPKRGRRAYEDYLEPAEIASRLKNGTLFQGVLYAPRTFSSGYITVEGFNLDLCVPSQKHRNRSFHGDEVVVELLPKSEWVLKESDNDNNGSRDQHQQDASDGEGPEGGRGKVVTAEDIETLRNSTSVQGAVKVVGIVKSNRPSDVVGVLACPSDRESDTPLSGDKVMLLYPLSGNLPLVLIYLNHSTNRILQGFQKKLYRVSIHKWEATSRFPVGRLVECLGNTGDVDTETQAICVQHQVHDVPFPEVCEVVSETMGEIEHMDREEMREREDFRGKRIFTIDPPDARDLDDAVHIEKLANGNIEIGVHIADVAFYVKPDCPIDIEAQKRTRSHYLVQKVVPMLPTWLCNGVCSLLPDRPRRAFSAVFEVSPDAEIVNEKFTRSLIQSCSKLSYSMAQLMLEEGDLFKSLAKERSHNQGPGRYAGAAVSDTVTLDQIAKDVQALFVISSILRKRRFDTGALSMNNPSLYIKLKEGLPDQVSLYETKEAHHLIEEFMLLANMRVAMFISQQFPEQAVLRHQPPPKDPTFEAAVAVFEKSGITLDKEKVAQSMSKQSRLLSPLARSVVHVIMTRSMQSAKYICTGSVEEEQWRHDALNVLHYTHFTSPIRRYPDLIVHRLLAHAIGHDQDEQLWDGDRMELMCKVCSQVELDARHAQEDSVELFLAKYLEAVGPLEEFAIVFRVEETRIHLFVPRLDFQYALYLEDLVFTDKVFNEEKSTMLLQNLSHKPESEDKPEPKADNMMFEVLKELKVLVGSRIVKSRTKCYAKLILE